MSEKKTMLVPGVDPSDAVDLKVSGAFFSRLQLLYFHMASTYPEEELKEAITGLLYKTKFEASEEQNYHLQTILILINSLDAEFKKAGLVKKKDVDLEP